MPRWAGLGFGFVEIQGRSRAIDAVPACLFGTYVALGPEQLGLAACKCRAQALGCASAGAHVIEKTDQLLQIATTGWVSGDAADGLSCGNSICELSGSLCVSQKAVLSWDA